VGQSHLNELGGSFSFGGGYEIPGTAGFSLSEGVSNAKKWGDTSGPFQYAGASGLGGAADVQWGRDPCNSYNVWVVGAGLATKGLPEFHRGGNTTWTASWSPG
jgi:hypothetical protein